jgi:MFS transporter, NNP family, nitrate/nitrite transporter
MSLSQASAGALYMFMACGTSLAVFAAGHLALLIGYKRLILISFSMLAAAFAGLSFAESYWTVGLILLCVGIASGLYLPSAIPMLTAIFERQHWGKVIAFHETAAGFSLVSIPLIIALLLGIIPWRAIFLLFAASIAVIIVVFALYVPMQQAEKQQSVAIASLFRRPEFLAILVLWVACGTLSMGIYNIIPLFLVNEKGYLLEQANQVFSMTRIGGFLGQIVIGFFLDRYSVRTILFLLTLAGGLATIGVAIVTSPMLLSFILLLQATFCVVFFPVGIVAIAKVTLPQERGIFTGVIMGISGLTGIGATPFLLGAIADIASFQLGFMLLGALTLVICPIAFKIGKI